MDRYLIHEIRTREGIYKVDYNSLANLPESPDGIEEGEGISIVSGQSGEKIISLSPGTLKDIEDLMDKVFPVTPEILESSGFGVFELGTSVTPELSWRVMKGSSEVQEYQVTLFTKTPEHSWVPGVPQEGTGHFVFPEVSQDTSWRLLLETPGEVVIGPLSSEFRRYRYYGVLQGDPGEVTENLVKGLQRDLQTTKTYQKTTLRSGEYFLFAVPGASNLIVRHSGTDAIVDSRTGTLSVTGASGSYTYTWVLVPASGNSWTFIITNT